MVYDVIEGPYVKLPRGLSFMLLLDNVRQLVVSNDLFIGIITNRDEELDVLVVLGVPVHDLAHNLSSDLVTIFSLTKEGQAKKLFRRVLRELQSCRINVGEGHQHRGGPSSLPSCSEGARVRGRACRGVGEERVFSRTNIGSDNNLLGVMGKDEVGESIALVLGDTNPTAKTFRLVWLFKEDLLPPMELEVSRHISHLVRHNRERDLALGVNQDIAEANDEEEAEEPELGWGAGVIHGVADHAFQILDAPLNGVLMLVVRFRLAIPHSIEAKEIKDACTEFRLGIVRHDANRGTIGTDEILKGMVHLRLRGKRSAVQELRIKAAKDLNHGATAMAGDAIIMRRNIREEGVGGEPFGDPSYVGSREPRLKVLAERMVNGGTVELSGSIKSGFDALRGDPGKVGPKEVQIRQPGPELSREVGQDSSRQDNQGSDNRGS